MSEWRETNLDEIVKFQRGHDLTVANILEGNYPVAGSNGIIGYHNQFTTVAPGITLGRSGNSIGVAHYYDRNFWAHNTTLYTTEFLNSWPKYVFYFLRTIDFSALNSGSAVPSLNRNHIHSIKVKTPDLPEQKAISSILSSLDDKIDLLHRQNKTLEAMAETLFRQWFVEEAQEDWKDIPFEEFFDFMEGPGIRNWQYTLAGTPFINIRLISNGDIDITKASFVSNEEANGKYSHFHLKEGDMIVSTSGTLGKNAIVRGYHLPLILNTSVIRFRPLDGRSYSFVYQYLNSRLFQEHLESAASGSVQANFGPTHLKQMKLSKPPQDVLDKYLLQADPIYDKLRVNQTQIKTLETLRDTLLPKLMSGEVRIAL